MGRFSSVLAKLNDRIKRQTAENKILAGFTFVDTPTADIEEEKDYPIIRQFMPDLIETPHARFISDGTMVLRLTVSSDRSKGLVDHLEHVEKFLDALERNPEGEIDLTLGHVIAKPMQVVVKEGFVLENSLTSQITISVLPNVVTRGARRI